MKGFVASALTTSVLLLGHPALAASYDEPAEEEKHEDEAAGNTKKLGAGGLNAPGELSEDDGTTETEKSLEEGDAKNSKRGVSLLWLDVTPGLLLTDLGLFSGATSEPLAAGVGPELSAALGVRALYWTLGPRFNYRIFDGHEQWSLVGEAAFHVPIGSWEPSVGLDLGYTAIPSYGTGSDYAGLSGWEIRPRLQIDYFLSETFSLGGSLTPTLYALSTESGNSVNGGALGLSLHFTFHYRSPR